MYPRNKRSFLKFGKKLLFSHDPYAVVLNLSFCSSFAVLSSHKTVYSDASVKTFFFYEPYAYEPANY